MISGFKNKGEQSMDNKKMIHICRKSNTTFLETLLEEYNMQLDCEKYETVLGVLKDLSSLKKRDIKTCEFESTIIHFGGRYI